MRTPQLQVTVEEIEDGLDETAWNDWTPRENKVLARRVQVSTSTGYLYLEEAEKDDPTRVHLYITVKSGRANNMFSEIDADLNTATLDEIIEALTLARDAAVSEWMLEPVTSGVL